MSFPFGVKVRRSYGMGKLSPKVAPGNPSCPKKASIEMTRTENEREGKRINVCSLMEIKVQSGIPRSLVSCVIRVSVPAKTKHSHKALLNAKTKTQKHPAPA
jgi:hypothetical protein